MSEKRKEKINSCAVLGVGDARASEMSAELQRLDSDSQYLDEVLTALAKRYDPESLVMGVFLGALITMSEEWLLPPGARCTPIKPALN